MSVKNKQVNLEAQLEVIIDYRGKTPPKSDHGIVALSAKSVKMNRIDYSKAYYISPETYKKFMTRGFPKKGDVLLTTEAPLGCIATLDRDGICTAQRLLTLRGKQGVLHNEYLKYYLQSAEGQHELLSRASGSTVQGIKRSEFKNIEISLPDFLTQQKIATILTSLDDKIELNQRMNKTLEEMAQALFKCWFVDFEPTRAKMAGESPESICTRLKITPEILALFPNKLDESASVPIPEGWGISSLDQFIEFNPRERLVKGEEAPYLEMSALPINSCWPNPPVQREFKSGTKFRNGDTLLARITPCLENGKTAYVNCLNDNEIAWGSTEYYVMRPKQGIPSEMVYLIARDPEFRACAISSMTGTSGRQRAQKNVIEAYEYALPTIESDLFMTFGEVAASLFSQIKNNALEMESLSQLRDTLLPKLLSGEISVENVEGDLGNG